MNNEVFDTVLLASLLNVVPERLKLLREVNRVLKPGGMISVLFPTPAFDNEKAIEISTQLNLGEISTAAISVWARVARKLQPDEICDEFSMAKFENVSIKLHLENNIASITGYKANTQFRARAKHWHRSRKTVRRNWPAIRVSGAKLLLLIFHRISGERVLPAGVF